MRALRDGGADPRRRARGRHADAAPLGRAQPAPRAAAARAADVRRGPAGAARHRRADRHVRTLNPTLQYLAPAQMQCNYVTLWFRNVSSLLSEGDTQRHLAAVHHRRHAAGPQQRGRPVAPRPPTARRSRTTCTPTRTRTPPSPGQPKECEAANEPLRPRPDRHRQRPGHPVRPTDGGDP